MQNLSVVKYVGPEKKAEWGKHWIEQGFNGEEKRKWPYLRGGGSRALHTMPGQTMQTGWSEVKYRSLVSLMGVTSRGQL